MRCRASAKNKSAQNSKTGIFVRTNNGTLAVCILSTVHEKGCNRLNLL